MKNFRLSVLVLSAAVMAVGSGSWADETRGVSAVAPKAHMQLPLGEPAPEIQATTIDGKGVTLASLRGKPVVLEFGSITDPWFRARVPAVESLAAKYEGKATVVIVYQRESHGADTTDAIEENETDGFAMTKPTSQEERYKLAGQARDRLHIEKEMLLVDAWSNTSSLRYGGYPNMAFVIDAQGKLQAGYPWMDPKKVQGAVDALLAGKAVPEELRGPVHPSGANGGMDMGGVAMDMTGYAQGAKLVTILDKLQLTDDQRKAVLPPLLKFLADARDFRETRTGQVPKVAKGAPAASQPADGTPKVVTADDLQAAIQKLRDGATKLKEAARANLSEADAKELIDALDQGPARRLFADN